MIKERKSAIKWIFQNMKPIAFAIVLLTFMGITLSYLSVEFAMAAGELLDVATGQSHKSMTDCVVRLIVLLLAEITIESVYNIYAINLSTRYKNKLQKNLFSTIMTRDWRGINGFHSGELINRLTSDVSIINSNIIDIIPLFVMLVTGVAFSFITLAKLDLSLAFICLALGPVVIVTSALYGRKMKTLHKKCQESDGRTRSFMQECIQNIIAVKAFRGENKAEKHTAGLQMENYRHNMKRGYISIAVNILYYLGMTVAYYFAVVWCAYKISIGIMSVGVFTAIIQLVNSIQSPFRTISGTVSQFFAICASAERIMEIEAIPNDVEPGIFPEDFTCITGENMTFRYDEEDVFSDANFRIDKGDIVVVSGDSGKGKSTLFKLLLGILKPQSGEVCVYNKEEKIIAGYRTRSLFAYVPQGNMIVSGTIRTNIAFFDEDVDEERLRHSAEQACMLDYIEKLPKGFDTVLGEGGMGLSEGQVQRLAIARALYADLPVILFDEATSALDEETEEKILKNIKSHTDKTCVIISHRSGAFAIADKILYTENKTLKMAENLQ